MIVQVAIIDHKHGSDAYVAASEDALRSAVYQYVKDWWDAEFMSDKDDEKTGDPISRPIPEDPQTAIDQYFEGMEGIEYLNWLGETEVLE